MKYGKLTGVALAGAVAAALGAIGTAATPANAQEIKLKAASFLPGRAVYAKYFFRWVQEVNKQCAGKVNISVVGPAAIKSLQQWKALQDGVIDMHFGPPNYYKGVLFEADVGILARNESADQRKNGAWKMLNDVHRERMGAVYLTHILNGVKFYIYTKKPHKNGRFDGFRLRSVAIYDPFFKSLGAQTVRIGAPGVYTALERGTVDGYGWPSWGVTDFGWHKYTKYRHGPGFFSAVVNILANQKKFESMPAGHRKCVMDMAMWLENQWPKWREQETKKQFAAQDKAGIKYVDFGPAFAKKAEDLYWQILEKANPTFINKIRPLLLKK